VTKSQEKRCFQIFNGEDLCRFYGGVNFTDSAIVQREYTKAESLKENEGTSCPDCQEMRNQLDISRSVEKSRQKISLGSPQGERV